MTTNLSSTTEGFFLIFFGEVYNNAQFINLHSINARHTTQADDALGY